MVRRVRAVVVAVVVTAAALTSGGCGAVQSPGRGPAAGHRPTHDPSASASASHHGTHRSEPHRYGQRGTRHAGEPVALTIPSLHVHATVLSRGATTHGFDLPTDVSDVAWYTGSRVPGVPGTAYLAGHRDDDYGHHGALYDLERLQPGAIIVIGTTAGPLRYRVTRVDTVPKTALAGRPLTTSGRSRILLVTCGGPLVRHHPGADDGISADGLLHYADNVLVTAVLGGTRIGRLPEARAAYSAAHDVRSAARRRSTSHSQDVDHGPPSIGGNRSISRPKVSPVPLRSPLGSR